MSIGYFLQCIYDPVAHLPVERHEIACFGEAGSGRSRVSASVLAGKKCARKRAPDEDTDIVILGERLEFVFQTPADVSPVCLILSCCIGMDIRIAAIRPL